MAAKAGAKSCAADEARVEPEGEADDPVPEPPLPELPLPPCAPPPACCVVVDAEDEMVPVTLGVPLL